MYLSNKTSIDFVAHHEIQFQACQGVFNELSMVHDCRALIGQDCEPSDATVAILLDHTAFQPRITKDNYKYLIHMSHDLGDWEIYHSERKQLSEFDLILVPGDLHARQAKKTLGFIPIFKTGWPKLDIIIPKKTYRKETTNRLNIIYAPTFINNREWVELLPALIQTGHKITIKNHVYYDFESGALPPKGSEEEYRDAIESLLDMEEFISKENIPSVEYIPRRENLCSLFPEAQLLVTDSSSASLEFLSYGPSIETGRTGATPSETKPSSSLVTNRVKYCPLNQLIPLLKDDEHLLSIINDDLRDREKDRNLIIYQPPHSPSKFSASLIDLFLYIKQNGNDISFRLENQWLWKAKQWL